MVDAGVDVGQQVAGLAVAVDTGVASQINRAVHVESDISVAGDLLILNAWATIPVKRNVPVDDDLDVAIGGVERRGVVEVNIAVPVVGAVVEVVGRGEGSAV